MTTDITLVAPGAAGPVAVVVSPEHGGRVRNITVSNGPESVDLLVASDDPGAGALSWGSFPMAPWVGRLRHGRFRCFGRDVHLDLNHDDGAGTGGGPIDPPVTAPLSMAPEDRRHTIHGTTYFRPWAVVATTGTRLEMTCRVEDARGFPFRGTARQTLELGDDELRCSLAVETDGPPFPAAVGWHPWFVKPDRLDFEPVAMYARDSIGMTIGELVAPTPRPWDDCFVNHRPARLCYDRPIAPVVTVDSDDCDHWVVFDELAHATCVEPQSGPPDAPNLRPELATSTRPLRRTMTIRW